MKTVYGFVTASGGTCHERNLTHRDLVEGLKTHTSAHGIPHITRARGLFKNTFWTLISIAASVLLIYNVTIISMKYFSYPVRVNIIVKDESEVLFPAVTVCNINPVLLSLIQENTDIVQLLSGSDTSVPAARKRRSILSPTSDATRGKSRTKRASKNDKNDNGKGNDKKTDTTKTKSAGVQLVERFTEVFAELPMANKSTLGITVVDFIVNCQYNGYECAHSEFTSFYDSRYGNCFTFNSGWDGTQPRSSYKPGPLYGLKLKLNIQADEYYPDLSESTGARVLIHTQTSMPFPEDDGMYVAPGEITSIGVRLTEIVRLPEPHGECVSLDGDNALDNIFQELHPVKYSVQACSKTCYQTNVIGRCGCFDARFPKISSVTSEVCSESNDTHVTCKEDVSRMYAEGSLQCDCRNPCVDFKYSKELSSTGWPSTASEDSEYSKLSNTSAAQVIADGKGKANLLGVEIYFQELNYQLIKQDPAYEGGNFLSDLGGTIGLWLGFSALTLFEFLEFGLDNIVLALCWMMNPRSGRITQDEKRDGITNSDQEKKSNLAVPQQTTRKAF